MEVIIENKTAILLILLAISEGLALIPSISANGIFQGIFSILKKLAGK